MSDENNDDHKKFELGNYSGVNGTTGIGYGNNGKIEISNIQNCILRCTHQMLKLQGKDHGNGGFNSGPVYESCAIYLANNTVKFPTDQNLILLMKSKNLTFRFGAFLLFFSFFLFFF